VNDLPYDAAPFATDQTGAQDRGNGLCPLDLGEQYEEAERWEQLVMGKKLYVGNLAYEVTSDDLAELFKPFGTVESANVIQDRDTGRSKGFGFVEMSTDEEAQAAIKALDGQEKGGRNLKVNEAKPREDRGGGGRGGRGGYGGGRNRY
jgi:cold-inducible RNA-binding protein